MESISHLFYNYFISFGLTELWAKYLNMIALLIISLLIIYLSDLIIKKILLNVFSKLADKTKSNFDNILVKNKVFRKIAHIIPFYIALNLIPIIFSDFDFLENIINKIVRVIYVLFILMVIRSLLNAFKDYFRTLPRLKDKPIDSFIQVVMIFMWVTGMFIIFAIISSTEIWKFFIR